MECAIDRAATIRSQLKCKLGAQTEIDPFRLANIFNAVDASAGNLAHRMSCKAKVDFGILFVRNVASRTWFSPNEIGFSFFVRYHGQRRYGDVYIYVRQAFVLCRSQLSVTHNKRALVASFIIALEHFLFQFTSTHSIRFAIWQFRKIRSP